MVFFGLVGFFFGFLVFFNLFDKPHFVVDIKSLTFVTLEEGVHSASTCVLPWLCLFVLFCITI